MLSSFPVVPTLPVEDLTRARQFYEDKLGLKPLDTSSSAVLYNCGKDTKLAIYKAEVTETKHIAVFFEVENLQDEIEALEKKGVVFERRRTPEIVEIDDITSLSPGNVVFFEDSEGNTLAMLQLGMLFELKGEELPFRK